MSTGDSTEPAASPRPKAWWRAPLMLATILMILYFILRPMYGDYADRAPVTEALALIVAARSAMVEQYANTGVWPETLPGGMVSPHGKYTQSIVITRGGGKTPEVELTATLRDTGVDRRVAGKTVRSYTKDGGKTWHCTAGTVPDRSMPASCRSAP